MKKLRCYGRVKTRNLDTSNNEAVFNSDAGTLKSLGVDPLKANSPPDPDTSSILLFSSFTQELPAKKVHKKRNLVSRPLKRMSTYLKRNQPFKSNNSSSNVSLFSELSFNKKVKGKIAVKGSKLSGRSILQCHQIKGKKVNRCLSETQSTASKKKLKIKKIKRRKLPRKCRKGNKSLNETIILSSSTNEPQWSSIYEHSLNIEKPLKKKGFTNFNNKSNLTNLADTVILLDNSPVPASLKTGISHVSEKRSTRNFQSSISMRSFSKVMHLPKVKSKAQVHKINIATSTPVVHNKKIHGPQFNVSEISQISKKDDLSSNVLFLSKNTTQCPSTAKNCSKLSFNDVSDTIILLDNSPTRKEIQSSTPISIHRSSSEAMHFPEVKEINIVTNTPSVRNKKIHGRYFNTSGRESNVLFSSRNTTQFPPTSNNCINLSFTSEYGPGNKLDPKVVSVIEPNDAINNDLNLILPSDQLLPVSNEHLLSKHLTYSNILHKSNLTTSQHQSTRSCELHPTFDKSVLNDVSTKRSFHSLDKVNLDCSESQDGYECNLLELLEFCEQDSVIGFEDVFDWSHTAIRKIGEGTYGEVFIITQKKMSSVIKVIPFFDVNAVPGMQPIESVFSEMKVAHCLSELRTDKDNQTKNFNKLKSAKIVKGCYPSKMLVAWDTFSEAKTTYNLRPDIFDVEQLFAILELEYGGKDMTAFVMRNAAEAECIFKQIAISLAIAEEACLFEHRDLHLGNILVQRNASKTIPYILRGKPFSIRNDGLVVTIIDFTLSRVLDSGCVFYNDLANDESLFNQSGDYQFEVYKATRQHLNNDWQKSALYSNVLWLSFLCVKIIKSEYSRPTSKKHLESMKNVRMMQKEMTEYGSAFEVFQSLQIVEYVPMRSQLQSTRLSTTKKYFDRKSIQKSLSGI